jgi:hypothetical protein
MASPVMMHMSNLRPFLILTAASSPAMQFRAHTAQA